MKILFFLNSTFCIRNIKIWPVDTSIIISTPASYYLFGESNLREPEFK